MSPNDSIDGRLEKRQAGRWVLTAHSRVLMVDAGLLAASGCCCRKASGVSRLYFL